MGSKGRRCCLATSSGIFLVLGLVSISAGLCVYLLKPPDKLILNHVEGVSVIARAVAVVLKCMQKV